MKMSVDQALRKARTLPPEAAQALYAEMLARFPANNRIRKALETLTTPRLDIAPAADLERIAASYRAGQMTQALGQATDLLTHFPNSEILHNLAGAIQSSLGQHALAIAHYDRAIALAPDYFEAYNNRGAALNDLGQYDRALADCDAAIGLHPDNAEALMNRGIALRRLQRLDEALASVTRSIALNPDCAEAYSNRGNMLIGLARSEEALSDFDTALAIAPRFVEALVNRGTALFALNRFEDAVCAFDAALAINPRQIDALTNRGTALRLLRRHEEALASHRRALELAPASARTQAEIRDLKAHLCDWSDGPDAPAALGTGQDAVPPFYVLAAEDDPERRLVSARNWVQREYGVTSPPLAAYPIVDRRVRIGYFSADFHDHATMHLLARILELHDRSRFEIHAFSYGPETHDALRRRLLATVDHFHDVRHVSDDIAAQRARAAGIDIAVDLKGHTQGSRLGIFARRAAPVQIGYLGYPGTSGANFIDYLIADPIVVPAWQQPLYSETLLYLPHCYQPNDDRRPIAARAVTRRALGLPEDGFVFCCFNNAYKITPAEFDIWMRLLQRTAGSVLWLLRCDDRAAANLRREAATRGVDPKRLVFAERMRPDEHLARHRHADLFLDTFNVNAHTTASDALWAGVPVVTRLGESFSARVAGSLLHALDLPELITTSAAAYEGRALDIAHDPAELARLKAKVARHRTTTPLFDSLRYTRDLETAYLSTMAAA
jgi:predicted O-linked N-acetylglucosamine transferase (SPINDLY family)